MTRLGPDARPWSWRPLGASTAKIARTYSEVFLVLAPPRTASTALARVFWNHPRLSFYCHEPFDRIYHDGEDPGLALRRIEESLDLSALGAEASPHRGLLIKEMTFQMGRYFPLLLTLATRPVVFLIRDPRLSVMSRIRRLKGSSRGGFHFPLVETGWNDLVDQIEWCRRSHVPHVVVDATRFRADPSGVLGGLFERLGLRFSDRQLHWPSLGEVELGNLGGRQSGWYDRALTSTGIAPPVEEPPPWEAFETVPGLRRHVERAHEIYRHLLAEIIGETADGDGSTGLSATDPADERLGRRKRKELTL